MVEVVVGVVRGSEQEGWWMVVEVEVESARMVVVASLARRNVNVHRLRQFAR